MKQYFVIFGLSTLFLAGGCAYPVVSPQQAGTYQVVPSQQPLATKLMIFGGEGHKTYLGCLNCDPMAYDSIFNAVGPYGRCVGLFTDNLFCRGPFKKFGSKGPFQARSACGSGAS